MEESIPTITISLSREDDEDLDDICPVCDTECICGTSTAAAAAASVEVVEEKQHGKIKLKLGCIFMRLMYIVFKRREAVVYEQTADRCLARNRKGRRRVQSGRKIRSSFR